MLKPEDVKQIIEGSLKGDLISQKKLFDIYSGKMFAICVRYASDYDKAKDFLQEGFIRVFKSLNQFRFEGSFEGWMKRIFVNTSIEFLRKEARNPEQLGLESYENIGYESQILSKLNQNDLFDLIKTLPTGYRTVFNLFVIEGYSHQEIAKQLGVSESTSKTQLYKARNYLMMKLKSLQ